MEIRDASPSDFLLKIENFSILLESAIEKHESSEFESGGYKWYCQNFQIVTMCILGLATFFLENTTMMKSYERTVVFR